MPVKGLPWCKCGKHKWVAVERLRSGAKLMCDNCGRRITSRSNAVYALLRKLDEVTPAPPPNSGDSRGE